jgi:hypothetical protein
VSIDTAPTEIIDDEEVENRIKNNTKDKKKKFFIFGFSKKITDVKGKKEIRLTLNFSSLQV